MYLAVPNIFLDFLETKKLLNNLLLNSEYKSCQEVK